MSKTGEMHQQRSLRLANIHGDVPGSAPRHLVCRITLEIYGKHRDLITP